MNSTEKTRYMERLSKPVVNISEEQNDYNKIMFFLEFRTLSLSLSKLGNAEYCISGYKIRNFEQA